LYVSSSGQKGTSTRLYGFEFMLKMHRSLLARYIIAVAAVTLSLGITYSIEPLRSQSQTILFFAAVVVSAWFGGAGPGLLASILSVLAIDYFFLEPVGMVRMQFPNFVRLAVFLLVAVQISWLTAARRRKEDALIESEERFRIMADSAPVMIWLSGPDKQRTYFNKGWLDFTGREIEQELGDGWTEGIHPDDLQHFLDAYANAFEARQGFEVEYRIRRYDGEYRWLLGKGMPRWTPDGRFGGYIGSSTDITERKQAESEREQLLERERAARREAEQTKKLISELLAREQAAREEAEEASRTKDEFLATISHELRTPLNAVLGWAEMLRAGKLDEATSAKALDIIERNARSQAQLIEDILDVSRIIRGRLRLKVAPVEMVSVIQEAVDVVRPAADAKNVRIQAVLDPRAGPVSGDSNRLQQIVWNLLSNAVKFTPKGGRVQVRLQVVDSHAEITVSDTGEGISPEFLPYVFDRFRQADSSFSRKHGGLGLGLSIVRHLTEMHGGTVQAISDGEGKGATFKLKLPLIVVHDRSLLKAAASTAATADYQPSLEGVSLLIVEDEPDARDLLVTILEQHGAQVRAAASAAEALEAIKQSKPDLLLSDIEMPGEDGYSLLRKVKSMEAEIGAIFVVALTAHTRLEDRVRALSAGFQSHISKPVKSDELISLISSQVKKSRSA
jgi:PAS domain S-box-containing protein